MTDNIVSLQDRKLDEAEARIEQAERNAYYVRGMELAEIHDKKMWLQRYNGTFKEYCEDRWELARAARLST